MLNVFPRLVSSVFLLLILMSSVTCKCKGKKCKIGAILENYKAVMFDELRSLKNITGIFENNEMLKHPKMFSCRSNKEQKILQSIYCMTLFLKSQVNCTAINDIDTALCKITNQMESVIKCHCNKVHQQLNRNMRCSTHQSGHKKRGKKHRKVKTRKASKEQLKFLLEGPGLSQKPELRLDIFTTQQLIESFQSHLHILTKCSLQNILAYNLCINVRVEG